jgi:hypothetical protein
VLESTDQPTAEEAPAGTVLADGPPESPESGDGSRAGSPVPKAAAGVVAVVLVMALLIVLLTRGGGGPIRDGEATISNSEEVLVEAEQLMAEQVTLADAAISDDSGCWFSYPSAEASTPNSFLRCGPVMFSDSLEGAPWMTYSVSFDSDVEDEGSSLATLGSELERSSQVAANEDLRRPDGRQAPSGEDAVLDAPPPPPVEERHIATASSDLALELDAPEDGRLYSTDTKLEILGIGRAQEIGDGPTRKIAPEGHELTVVKFSAEGDGVVAEQGYYSDGEYMVDDDAASSANLVLSVDGVRRPFPGWGGDGPHHVVFAAPADATDVELILEENGVRSTFSLSEMERTEGAPALYVGSPEVFVQRAYNSPGTWLNRSGVAVSASADGRLNNVQLTPWTEDLGRAPEGQVWAIMEWSSFDMSLWSIDSWEPVLAKTASAMVGDKTYPATHSEDLVTAIPVPDDVTELVITYRPVILYSTYNSGSGELAFDQTLTLTIDFENGTVSG